MLQLTKKKNMGHQVVYTLTEDILDCYYILIKYFSYLPVLLQAQVTPPPSTVV